MTASGGTRARTALVVPKVGDVLHLLDQWTGAVFRPVRPVRDGAALVPAWRRLAKWGAVVVIAIGLSMLLLDAAAFHAAVALPDWVNRPFNEFTDFGRSIWFLLPLGLLYLGTVVLATAPIGRVGYGVLVALAGRFGFLFVAIGMPSLVVSVVKRLIGRVRPSALGPFAYEPFAWRSEYASLPSGHTTTAFAALVAIGLVVPRLRPLMWVFAVLIGVSRVVVASHFPSDVIAGAAFGAFGAIMVRDWFAARRLGFYIASDGAVRPLPGPSIARMKRVARALLGQ